ncbi:MAG: DUF2306 domain-containing protein [Planctomycetota bacterium]
MSLCTGVGIATFLGMLREYAWYFPPDYDRSAFLGGRRHDFGTLYSGSFYLHVVCGPPIIMLAAFSMAIANRPRWKDWHRRLGRVVTMLTLVLLVPSGLLMSLQAYGGPLAASGFIAQTTVTAVCGGMAGWTASVRRFEAHSLWATRLFVLLMSPLVLRVLAGIAVVTQRESVWTYRVNAWISWLVPLLIVESQRHDWLPSERKGIS